MKIILASLVMLIVGVVLGSLFGDQFNVFDDSTMMEGNSDSSPLYWVAPMDKNYRREGPGQSPMGMDLVPVYEENNGGDEGTVKISSVVENNLGVKTGLVKSAQLIMPVETVGMVQFDESKITHIHSRVEGWIEVLNVSAAGDPVKKGQTLYELYSPSLVNAQEEFLAALRSGNKSLIRASKSRLFSLGLDDKQAKRLKKRRKVDQRIKILAEYDGVIIDLKVRQGMYIKPSTKVLSLGSLDSVWVLGEIFERQSYLVVQGQDVEIELNAMPGKIWKGSLDYVYPQLDPKTRTLTIRVQIANADHFLKPNMLASLRVLSMAQESTLTIPKQALIKAGRYSRVVKSLGDGKYKSALVEAGFEGVIDGLIEGETEQRIQIISGLVDGDRVVTSAQFLIDSESNIDAEMSRMSQSVNLSSGNMEKTNTKGKIVRSRGIIENIVTKTGMINLSHEPIPELGWPEMNMDFSVSDHVRLDSLSVGEQISFELFVTPDNAYVIEKITEMKRSSGEGL